jgi:hypothetical protein
MLSGKGTLHKGPRAIATVYYTVQTNVSNGQATVVQFEPKPPANDGDLVHLTLEDGRVLNCQILDDSPYCAVIGDGPIIERRSKIRELPSD